MVRARGGCHSRNTTCLPCVEQARGSAIFVKNERSCHHQLGTHRVDHYNIGNQNVIHIEAKNNSMKEITAHENNDQQTCLSTTERKLNKAQTQTNLTKNSGTNKLHHTRKVQRDTHSSCNFSTTLDIRLNATIARTETAAHLDGDLHRHGTRTANVVHD